MMAALKDARFPRLPDTLDTMSTTDLRLVLYINAIDAAWLDGWIKKLSAEGITVVVNMVERKSVGFVGEM